MRPKSISQKKKRLQWQLNKVLDMPLLKHSKKKKRDVPTLRGRIERKLQTIKNTKV